MFGLMRWCWCNTLVEHHGRFPTGPFYNDILSQAAERMIINRHACEHSSYPSLHPLLCHPWLLQTDDLETKDWIKVSSVGHQAQCSRHFHYLQFWPRRQRTMGPLITLRFDSRFPRTAAVLDLVAVRICRVIIIHAFLGPHRGCAWGNSSTSRVMQRIFLISYERVSGSKWPRELVQIISGRKHSYVWECFLPTAGAVALAKGELVHSLETSSIETSNLKQWASQ